MNFEPSERGSLNPWSSAMLSLWKMALPFATFLLQRLDIVDIVS